MMEHPDSFTDLNVQTGEQLKAVIALALLLSGIAAIAGVGPVWLPAILFAAAAIANRELAAVFARAGGWWLALRGLLFHQLYFLYSGAVYVISAIRHRRGAQR
jgi:hypothetical protein